MHQSIIAPVPLLADLESAHESALRRIKQRYGASKMAETGLRKPRVGSQLYYDFLAKGYISPEEAEADQLEREIRAARTGQQRPARHPAIAQMALPFPIARNTPLRWARQSPIPSDQYAPNMATTAARDERLTPNAKALLVVLHARCAKTGETETTKGTLANIFNRSTRSIQRYLKDLTTFGYITARTRVGGRGLYIGLTICVQALAKPFYEDMKATVTIVARALQDQLPAILGKPCFSEETYMSSKKQSYIFRGPNYGKTEPPD